MDSHSDFESDRESHFDSLKRSLFHRSHDLESELDRLCEGLFKEDPFDDSRFTFSRPTRKPFGGNLIPRDTPKECIIEDANGQRKFQAKLNISEFDPESVGVSVSDENKVTVKANREMSCEGQRTTTELNRSFQLPKEVDPDKLASKLTGDGTLVLEAPLPPDYEHVQSQRVVRRVPDSPEVPKYYYSSDGRKEMVLLLGIGTGFDPDDMQVNVDGNILEIKAFKANDVGPATKRISFSRTYELKQGVDPDSVRAILTDQGKLRISADVIEPDICLVSNCNHENHCNGEM